MSKPETKQKRARKGVPVGDRIGIHWGVEGLPGIVLSAAQSREFARRLVEAADAMGVEET